MTTYKEFLSDNLFPSAVSYTQRSSILECDGIDSIGIFATSNAVTMAAVAYASATDINATSNVLTKAHTFVTGSVVRVATSTTLPDPLVAATDYFVIKVSATEIKLATSLANALAGTAIDLIDVGVGNQTVTAATSGACTLTLEVSPDNSLFVPYAAATTLTAAGNHIAITKPAFNYFRIKLTIVDNQFTIDTRVLFKDFLNDLK